MKKIALVVHGIVTVPTHSVNLDPFLQEQKEARNNGKKVIYGALVIEKVIVHIIATYFIRGASGLRKRFEDTVLSTDSFTFFLKWKTLREILSHTQVLNEADRKHILTRIKSAMSYRNAFAHGTFITRDGNTYLQFYNNGQQEVNLSEDSYWDELEETINGSVPILHDIERKINSIADSVVENNDKAP